MSSPRRSRRPTARRFLPYAAVGLVAVLTLFLPPGPDSWPAAGLATGLSAAIGLAGFLVPWERAPRWTYVVPPLAYLGVVAALREAQGGSTSGYAVLAILPVVWAALNLGRRELGVVIVGVAVVFALPPLALDGDRYPPSEWRRAFVSSLVALIMGFTVQALVSQRREEARRARRRAEELAASEATIAAVARVARTAWSHDDARAVICQAALEVSGARIVSIAEPDATGRLSITAATGGGLPAATLTGASGSAIAFDSGRRHVVRDAQNDPAIVQAARETGIESAIFEPILRNGKPIGILAVGWASPLESVPPSARTALELLAAEAGRAIGRAAHLRRLQHLAETDALTGLPNRRSWELRLPELTAHAHTQHEPLCVAILDLDRFKLFNDRHGHQRGDRLLEQAATAWEACLRRDDLLARYGGEEFALVLPAQGLHDAARVVDRLRRATPLGQTCSAGVAELLPGESPDALIARADRALYEAKHSGRDRLVLAQAA